LVEELAVAPLGQLVQRAALERGEAALIDARFGEDQPRRRDRFGVADRLR